MRMRSPSVLVSVLLSIFTLATFAEYESRDSVKDFINELAVEDGFNRQQLAEIFEQVEKKQRIIDLMSRPAEKAKPWHEYRQIFVTSTRIASGVEFWKENQATLDRARLEFGIPAEIIVAVIGVETNYGRNTGSFRVMDALSTLAFDYPPRSRFFRGELRELLLLAREENKYPLDLTGSYAGAMGYGQFIPSSFRAYAIDFDGDGITDLAVGAYRDDDGGTDKGAVYILFLNDDATVKSYQKISDTAGNFDLIRMIIDFFRNIFF